MTPRPAFSHQDHKTAGQTRHKDPTQRRHNAAQTAAPLLKASSLHNLCTLTPSNANRRTLASTVVPPPAPGGALRSIILPVQRTPTHPPRTNTPTNCKPPSRLHLTIVLCAPPALHPADAPQGPAHARRDHKPRQRPPNLPREIASNQSKPSIATRSLQASRFAPRCPAKAMVGLTYERALANAHRDMRRPRAVALT